MQLQALQRSFAEAIFTRGTPAPAGIPEARFDVYRNNAFSNFRAALTDVYPVIVRLVGEAFFAHAADAYIGTYPSESGDLHDFGGEFHRFLASFEPAAALPYLPDVARLEWAWHRVFHAADAPAFDLASLASVPADRQASIRFHLNPAARLVGSAFPILRIWQVSQPGFEGDDTVNLDEGGDRLLVIRDASFQVSIESIPPAQFALLTACDAHADFGAAVAAALAIDPTLDIGSALQRLLARNVLSGFSLL